MQFLSYNKGFNQVMSQRDANWSADLGRLERKLIAHIEKFAARNPGANSGLDQGYGARFEEVQEEIRLLRTQKAQSDQGNQQLQQEIQALRSEVGGLRNALAAQNPVGPGVMSLEQLEEFQFLRREVQWVRDHWAEANPEVQGLRQEVERLRAQIQVPPEGGPSGPVTQALQEEMAAMRSDMQKWGRPTSQLNLPTAAAVTQLATQVGGLQQELEEIFKNGSVVCDGEARVQAVEHEVRKINAYFMPKKSAPAPPQDPISSAFVAGPRPQPVAEAQGLFPRYGVRPLGSDGSVSDLTQAAQPPLGTPSEQRSQSWDRLNSTPCFTSQESEVRPGTGLSPPLFREKNLSAAQTSPSMYGGLPNLTGYAPALSGLTPPL